MLTIIENGVVSAVTMGGTVLGAIFGTAGGEGTAGSWAVVQDVIGLQIGLGIVGWTIAKSKSLIWGF